MLAQTTAASSFLELFFAETDRTGNSIEVNRETVLAVPVNSTASEPAEISLVSKPGDLRSFQYLAFQPLHHIVHLQLASFWAYRPPVLECNH